MTSHAIGVNAAPELEALARAEASPEVAQELEAMFWGMLVKELRKGFDGQGGLFGQGPGSDLHGAAFDEALGGALAANGGLGIAELVVRGELER